MKSYRNLVNHLKYLSQSTMSVFVYKYKQLAEKILKKKKKKVANGIIEQGSVNI
jgi:hypothetical protein